MRQFIAPLWCNERYEEPKKRIGLGGSALRQGKIRDFANVRRAGFGTETA
jgi:hypothetical protein